MSPPGSSAAFDSFNKIATVRIELRDTDPVIWRQVEVPTSITLKVLHRIIQAAMGWLDYHLWEFTIDKRRYGLPTDEDWGTEPRTDAAKVRLRDVLRLRTTTIDYLYDFGDCWDHQLTVTNIRTGDPDLSYPRYIARRAQCAARGLRRHTRLLPDTRRCRRPHTPEPCRSQEMARRLRSQPHRRAANQICPQPYREPAQRRQGSARQQETTSNYRLISP